MLQNLNHLTLAVSELERSFRFYTEVLGLQAHARWDGGAYLSAGTLWLCLSLDKARDAVAAAARDYTHYAFSIEAADLPALARKVAAAGVQVWKDNASEGESLYFLDPDGHQLEAHAGDLASRLSA